MSVQEFENALPPTVPIQTEHIQERWDERTDSDLPPVTAWYEGVDVTARLRTYLSDSLSFRGLDKRVRYHEPTDTLLVRKGMMLATVLSVEQYPSAELRQTIRLAFDEPADDREAIAGDDL